ncbi:unnamed protein product [Lactuca virosa]|uniref:Plastid lipid-associated protein/fibrillin conserved domain-containing protein n=1 Tax=Lactuca virosa TaxID=75947 RepID=A0AAU9PM27_9ASTR|nr:unnamed protein product [Lactuca virosa]
MMIRYIAFSKLLPLLAVGTHPLLKVDKICQQISTTTLTIDNSITFSTPFATFTSTASANFEVRSPSRIQLYNRLVQTNIPQLLPLMVAAILVPGPNKVPPHLKTCFTDLKGAQVKTVSFMTYLLKSFADYIRPQEESICKSIVASLLLSGDAIDSYFGKSVHSVNQGIKTITFKIGGIEYASCSSSNESLLMYLNGVSPLQGQGVVPELVDVKAIKETIEDAGFEVKEFSDFEVNSKNMLDPVTMCPRESDGLALNQSSECCILVKPKHLKFDEMDGCDSIKVSSLLSRIRELLGNPSMNMDSASLKDDKTSEQQSIPIQLKSAMIRSHEDFDACTSTETMNIDLDLDLNPLVEESLLPKNRKLDGFLGQECNSASTIVDHKSSEKQLPMENVESSKLKAAMTRSHDNFDECAKDDMLDMDEYRMVEDVEHNPMVSLHDDAVVYSEPTFTEVESAASESDQTSNADVGFTVVDSDETVTLVSKFSSTQHQVEDFYYEDMDISTSDDYDLVTVADYSFPTQQQTDDSLPFNWQTKHFCSSPVDLGKLWDRSTSTLENPFGDLTSNITSFVPQKQAAAVSLCLWYASSLLKQWVSFFIWRLGMEVVPLLMKAIGWQGGSILALETLKCVVVAGNRAWDALVA